MKTFQDFISESKSDYTKDPSNPNLLKSASGSFKGSAGDKIKVKKYRNGKVVATTSYTLSGNQTSDDLIKDLNDKKTDNSVEYKL